MILPHQLKHYYELKAGKYIRYGQNHLGQSYLSIEEVTRAAFLKKDYTGKKVWKYAHTGYQGKYAEGYISSLMESAQCYPYSDDLYQFFKELSEGNQVIAYAFLHPNEAVDDVKAQQLKEKWEQEREFDHMMSRMADEHYESSYQDDPPEE